MNALTTLINFYSLLNEQEASIKSQKEIMKQTIIDTMKSLGVTSFTTEAGKVASITNKTTFKYKNEDELIMTLFENGARDALLETKVITTNFNKLLKSSPETKAKYQQYLVETTSPCLSVK